MTWIGQKETLKEHALRTQKKSNCTHRDFRKVTGRYRARRRNEVLWYKDYKTEGTWNFLASKMVQNFQETKHPVFTSISALNRGILRKIKGKSSLHINAESTNSELLFKIILCESAQFLRSSCELTLTIRLESR